MPKQRLTDRQLISGVTLTDLLHFVVTGDTSQSPAGSSYKGSVEQLFNGFSSYNCSTPLLLDTVNACTSAITINGNVIINGSATTINTEVIQSKDNNIVLNYSGTHLTAIGGGITLEDGQSNGVDSRIYTDSNGTWLFDPGLSASTGTIDDFTANTISVTTIGNSGDCVSDLYVSNIHSCSPLNINPLDEGNIYFGSTSGVTIDLTNNRVGIGTNTPSEKLEVDGNTKINGTLTLPAGTTTDPSLILTDGGTLLTSPQIGAFEFLGTSLYFTDFTGVRRNILLAQSGFTASTVNELQDTEVSTVSNGETWYYDGGIWRNTNIISIDNNNVKATIDGDLDVSGNTKINGSLNIGTLNGTTPTTQLAIDTNGFVVDADLTEIQNVYYVSPSGDNNTAVRGDIHKPWQTITGARNSVVADISASTVTGDTLVYVYPGEYVDQEIQYDNGNFYFTPNTTLTLSPNTTANKTQFFRLGTPLVNTSNVYSANTCNVYGHAKFIVSASTDGNLGGGVIDLHGDSKSHFECDSTYGVKGTLFSTYDNSELKLKANVLELITNDYVITARDGSKTFIDVTRIKGGTGGWAIYYTGLNSSGIFEGKSILNVDELVGGITYQPLGFSDVSDGAEIILNVNKLSHEPNEGSQWLINNTRQKGGRIIFNGNTTGIGRGLVYGVTATGGEFNYNGTILVSGQAISVTANSNHKFILNGDVQVSGTTSTPITFAGGNIELNGSLFDLNGTGANGMSLTSATNLKVKNFSIQNVLTNSIIGSGTGTKSVNILNSLYVDKPLGSLVTTTGQYVFTGTTYSSNLNLYNTPTNNNSLSQILGRNSSTGNVEYVDVSEFSSDYWVSGSSGNFSLKRLNSSTIDAAGDYSLSVGFNTIASGFASYAEGSNSVASGDYSHAEGSNTKAIGGWSHVEGENTIANNPSSHAGGINSIASGDYSFIHSNDSVVIGNNSVVLGGIGITGTSNNTVYVPNLNIGIIGSGTSVTNLGLDSNGYVISGITGGGGGGTTQATGLTISFTSKEVYNTPTSPGTGNITDDLTSAQLGIIQKIYHNSGSAPTVPAGWVLLGDGIYFTSQLNIIYAEWVSGSRVEYWIVQEQ